MFEKKIAWPKYQIIAKRIKVFSFDEISTHSTHNEHKQLIKQSIEQIGFLNPPVITKEKFWCSGNHSFNIMQKKDYTHIICYQALNKDEEYFLSRMNKLVWEIIKRGDEVRSFEFIFQDSKLNTLIEKCKTLLEP